MKMKEKAILVIIVFLLAFGLADCRKCNMGQEPDTSGALKWVLKEEDPESCKTIVPGGVNTHAVKNGKGTLYFDEPKFTLAKEETMGFLLKHAVCSEPRLYHNCSNERYFVGTTCKLSCSHNRYVSSVTCAAPDKKWIDTTPENTSYCSPEPVMGNVSDNGKYITIGNWTMPSYNTNHNITTFILSKLKDKCNRQICDSTAFIDKNMLIGTIRYRKEPIVMFLPSDNIPVMFKSGRLSSKNDSSNWCRFVVRDTVCPGHSKMLKHTCSKDIYVVNTTSNLTCDDNEYVSSLVCTAPEYQWIETSDPYSSCFTIHMTVSANGKYLTVNLAKANEEAANENETLIPHELYDKCGRTLCNSKTIIVTNQLAQLQCSNGPIALYLPPDNTTFIFKSGRLNMFSNNGSNDWCYFVFLDRRATRDCQTIRNANEGLRSGVYTVHPHHSEDPIEVFCHMDAEGNGWIVFQRRLDGSVNFTRLWESYKNGFGNLSGEFWLGNEHLHLLTAGNTNNTLRIELTDRSGTSYNATYEHFAIGAECDGYNLIVGQPDQEDNFADHHSGLEFCTEDRDCNGNTCDSCARIQGGGWWFQCCFQGFLNGQYVHSRETNFQQCSKGTSNAEEKKTYCGLIWFKFSTFSLKSTEMKFRRRQ